MEYEEKAWGKMALAFSKDQRKEWNSIRGRMWYLSDFIKDRASMQYFHREAKELHELVSRLPLLDIDGQGFSCGGNPENEF
jgi:hypothetical protein